MGKKDCYEENRILSFVAAQPGWRVLLPNFGQPHYEDIGAWAQVESRMVRDGDPGPWQRYEGLVPMINQGNGGLNICDGSYILSPSDSGDPEFLAGTMEQARKDGEADEKRWQEQGKQPHQHV